MVDPAFGSVFASPEKFVKALYRDLLRREPDEPGRNAYLEQLGEGLSRLDVIRTFLLSPEYEARARSDEEFVSDLYIAVFQRMPVEGVDDVKEWTETVRSAGRAAAIERFMAAPEVVALYEACDSFLSSSSPYGSAGIVFRGGRIILRNSTGGGHVPLEVTRENWPVLKKYLELIELRLVVEQIEPHLNGRAD